VEINRKARRKMHIGRPSDETNAFRSMKLYQTHFNIFTTKLIFSLSRQQKQTNKQTNE
jgi:hypothetical protein